MTEPTSINENKEAVKDPRETRIEDLAGPKSKEELEEKRAPELDNMAENDSQADGVTKSKICIQCEKPKDIATGFGRHAKTKDGYANTCLECRSKTMVDRSKKISGQLKTEKKEQKLQQGDNPVISLDFTGREDLLEEICNIAEDRLRKPESQILWWLMNTDFDKLPNWRLSEKQREFLEKNYKEDLDQRPGRDG